MFFPALVAQQVDLGDDANMVLGAGAYDLFYVRGGEGETVDEFGVGFELVVVIYEQEEGVDLTRCELFGDESHEGIEAVGSGYVDAETSHRYHAIERALRLCLVWMLRLCLRV